MASDKAGQAAGAGVAIAATAVADAVGYHPTFVIASAATAAGTMAGGMVQRAMSGALDRIAAGRGASPIGTVMAQLAAVVQTLDQVDKGISQVIDSVNKAQAHVQKISRGQGNNLLNGAVRAYRQAPERLEAGVAEIKQADVLVGQHLHAVAKAGG